MSVIQHTNESDLVSDKKITRQVVKLDTSNQCRLFAEEVDDTPLEAPKPACRPSDQVRFEDPDPWAIRLNQGRLDEHLIQAGQKQALKLREILETLDWGGFEQAYKPGGRRPYAPRAMLGVIVYGILQGVSSLRPLEKLARTDLGCMWVCGGILPDHSILGRFIERHEDQLTGAFFEQLTTRVLKVTGSGTQALAGDGSVIEAAASRFAVMKAEALAQAIERTRAHVEQVEADGAEAPSACQRLEQLEQAQVALAPRQARRQAKGKPSDSMQVNVQDPEAVIQPQKGSKHYAASYKPSVLANEARVIVSFALDPSSETAVVPQLLDQAQRQGAVDTALFDAGYCSDAVIEASAERDIELLCPEGRSQGERWTKTSSKYYPKSQFMYDREQDCYRCPQGQVLLPVGRYAGNHRYPAYTLYGTPACGQCAFRERCTRRARGRQIKRYDGDDAKDALRAKMQQPEVQARYRQRQAMAEPVFGGLRDRQGLRRFRRKGVKAVRLEFGLHVLAYNLGRALAREAFLRLHAGLKLAIRTLYSALSAPHEDCCHIAKL